MITIKKLYKAYAEKPAFLKEKSVEQKFVLKDINLEIKSGEKVAILGRNGAGKTTLLRLIAGSLVASSGEIRVDGSMYPLQNIGLGVNEKFTGYENIFSALVYTGFDFNKTSLKNIIKDVEEFCELGEFLNEPLAYYSLGMKARLMFAIATVVNSDIFLIDEILSSVDPYFILKFQERFGEIINRNKSTLLLVSHSTQQLRRFCHRGVWIKDGEVFLDGDINEVTTAYDAYIEKIVQLGSGVIVEKPEDLSSRLDDGRLVYKHEDDRGLWISGVNCTIDDRVLEKNENIVIYLKLRSEHKQITPPIRILVTFWDKDGRRTARFENDFNCLDFRSTATQTLSFICKNLLPDNLYYIAFSIYKNDSQFEQDGALLKRVTIVANVAKFYSKIKHLNVSNILPHTWR